MTRRSYLLLLLLGLLIFLGACSYKGYRLVAVTRSLRGHQVAAETLLANGIVNAPAADTAALVHDVRADVVALRDETSLFLPLSRSLGWLPRVGPLLADAPELLELADAGTLGAVYLMDALQPTLVALQEGGDGLPLAEIVTTLDGAGPELLQAESAVARAAVARAQLGDTTAYPGPLPALFNRLDPYWPLAADSVALLRTLPALLGGDQPRTYLIIAQNEDELRPSGGFISGAGLLTVAGGDIVSLSFQDANIIDDWRNKPYAFPPQPLYDFMGIELFLFRNANFWPDFPTSAEMAMILYTYGQGMPLDGAIAINQRFVEQLLAVTGPVFVPELDETVSRANVLGQMRAAWSIDSDQSVSEWIDSRKNFMGPLAAAIRLRVEETPGDLDLIYLFDTIQAAIAARNLQIYVRDPAAAAILRDLHWDGRLATEPGLDLLMVVEANVGYKKTNPNVSRSLAYSVQLDESGGEATAAITYVNQSPDTGELCDQATSYSGGLNYEVLTSNCYWNYLRLYAPAGSTLLAASSHPAPASAFLSGRAWDGTAAAVGDPTGLAAFENLLLVPRAATVATTFTYRLPATALRSLGDGRFRYELHLYKQGGVNLLPATIRITLPDGARVGDVDLDGAEALPAIDGSSVTLSADLTADIVLRIAYELNEE